MLLLRSSLKMFIGYSQIHCEIISFKNVSFPAYKAKCQWLDWQNYRRVVNLQGKVKKINGRKILENLSHIGSEIISQSNSNWLG
jgi:hypothetical protein